MNEHLDRPVEEGELLLVARNKCNMRLLRAMGKIRA